MRWKKVRTWHQWVYHINYSSADDHPSLSLLPLQLSIPSLLHRYWQSALCLHYSIATDDQLSLSSLLHRHWRSVLSIFTSPSLLTISSFSFYFSIAVKTGCLYHSLLTRQWRSPLFVIQILRYWRSAIWMIQHSLAILGHDQICV
jgi:hypothetical protein